MRSALKTVAVLIALLLVTSICGCFLTVSENLKNGSTMLLSSYESLNKDYSVLLTSIEAMIAEQSEENITKFKETEKMFKDGFDAVGIAIKSMDEAIQAIGSKKTTGVDGE